MFLVVFVLTITLSRIDYQCQVMRTAVFGLTCVSLPLCSYTCRGDLTLSLGCCVQQ